MTATYAFMSPEVSGASARAASAFSASAYRPSCMAAIVAPGSSGAAGSTARRAGGLAGATGSADRAAGPEPRATREKNRTGPLPKARLTAISSARGFDAAPHGKGSAAP